MVIRDSFRRLILPGFFRIGVNGRRHLGCRPVVTLRVSYRPFEDLRAVSLSNRFMAKTAPEPHLMVPNDDFLDRLMSDRD